MRALALAAWFLAWASVPAAQTPPLLPDSFRAVVAPADYRQLWARAVEAFGDRPATTFDNIVWYATPGSSFPCAEGPSCYGRWIREGDHHYIVLADGARGVRARVLHEMIHAILGNGRHSCEFEQLRRQLGAA